MAPGRLSQEKAQAIAREYCTNGHNEVNALTAVGYKKNYAERAGKKLFNNVQVIDEIKRIEAKTNIKVEWTMEQSHKELAEVGRLALEQNKLNDVISAIRERNELAGYHKQRIIDESEHLKAMTEEEEREAKRLATLLLAEKRGILLNKEAV